MILGVDTIPSSVMDALIIATDGFEDSELYYPYYRLQENGWAVQVATPGGYEIEGKHGYEFDGDLDLEDRDPERFADTFDLVVIPGGSSPETLRTEAPVAAAIVAAFDEVGVPIASICHGAQLLISADVLEGREIAAYWSLEVDVENAGATFVDDEAVVDENLITSRVPGDLPAFMNAVFEWLEQEESVAA